MTITFRLSLALAVCVSVISGQQGKPLSDTDLAAITNRGRLLEEYDVAAWHATDAVKALNSGKDTIGRYIARKTDSGWVVDFGRLNRTKDAFLIAYEANHGKSPQDFTIKTLDPPRADTGFLLSAAKAIDIAMQNFPHEARPYNVYILPLDSGEFYVYILPAQTVTGVYPLGGDTRFLVSADCSKIIETRQLHKTIFEITHSDQPGKKAVGHMHAYVLTDTPEDTDVFHVLRQTPPLPEYVGTKSGVYVAETDGRIERAK